MITFKEFLEEGLDSIPGKSGKGYEHTDILDGNLRDGSSTSIPVYMKFKHAGKGTYTASLKVDHTYSKERDFDRNTGLKIVNHVEKAFTDFHQQVKPSKIIVASNHPKKMAIYHAKFNSLAKQYGGTVTTKGSLIAKRTIYKTDNKPEEHKPSPYVPPKKDDKWKNDRTDSLADDVKKIGKAKGKKDKGELKGGKFALKSAKN